MARTPRKSGRQRYFRRGWAFLCFTLLSPMVLADNDIVWGGIQEPGLKDALFLSYKGMHFEAITRLQAELKLGRIKDQEQASLVLGGLYLAYGFNQEAEKIFQAFLDKDQPAAVANQAWFYLAKTLYHRGQFQLAKNALASIHGDLGLRLQSERKALESMVLMNLGEYQAALKALPEVGKNSGWWTYSRYNMGVALYRLGHKEQGINILDEVGQLADVGEETQVVKDKANLALGYGYLAQNKPEQAKIALNRMQLDGPYANRALLGLGRAYSANREHDKSLIPWLKLVERNPSDPAVQDGLMAVPFAFGQLQAYKQSLDYYEKAMLTFQQEIQNINSAADAVGGGKLIEGLMRAESGESVGGLWSLKKVLDTPEGRYLWPLLASREFTKTFYNYKQLRMSLGKLEGWSAALNTYKSLDDTQRQAYKNRITRLQSRVLLASEKLNHHLQSLAYDELDRRKKRLVNYFNEARFSVAQIYDYAAKRWGTKHE
jgi:tetratricopeptide (TPR) repeat protein